MPEEKRDRPETFEARLRASESRWRTLIECAPDAIAVSRAGRIVYANAAAAALLDYDRPEDLRGVSFAEFHDQEALDLMRARIATLRPGGPPTSPGEYRARSRRGRELVVEVRSVLIDDADGPAVLGFVRDVTESRRLQAQLARADRLAAVGTLAAGVAHEINNPLAFMRLALDALERQAARGPAPPDDATFTGTLAEVRGGVERIATIARQLFTFARRETDPSRPPAPADVGAALATAARMVEPELRGRGTLIWDVSSLPAVRADPGALEQVFLNLLINAAHALPPGRGNGRVRLAAERSGAHVSVTVSDDGVGIAAADLPRVFDPFFSTKEPGQGTGLGLSVCHTLVAQMSGEIGIDSAPGRGTTVRVILPAVEPAAPPAAAVAPRRTPRSRILVVDDEEAIRRILARALGGDHEVMTADSAAAALDRLQESDFDLLLIDFMMPIMGGREMADLIGRERPQLVPRMVFMTGGPTADTVEVVGVPRPVLRKPFALEQVEALLAPFGEARRDIG